MKFTCLCCTFLRPKQLSNSIACFEQLDYPLGDRELLILDDAGQYPDEPSGPNWQIISVKRRFSTLGQKRNALAAFADHKTDAFVVWDDDDAYLPWTLRAHEWAFSTGAEWSAPHIILNEIRESPYLQYHRSKNLFHAAWAFSRDAFTKVGGYPWKNSGEDQAFGSQMAKARIPASDPTQLWPPYFIHRWSTSGSWHLSAYGSDGYEKVGNRAVSREIVERLTPKSERDWPNLAFTFLEYNPLSDVSGLCHQWQSIRSDITRQVGLSVPSGGNESVGKTP